MARSLGYTPPTPPDSAAAAELDELVQALVTLYRGIAGSGMSSYMEAYTPSGPVSPSPR